ncbi:uncharacterized protein LOC122668226 [Telopea speciosissima]|uniref:uncharacterized protein LOC122668226 n=1 Tax=Telopea speciosissima TaxID=54955 RepID=UPI001CC3B0BC|nr:uncharacterized protein LOC122668226 [Telopea speciosissima]
MTKEGVSGQKVETSDDFVSLLKAIQQLGRRKDTLEMLSQGFCPRDKGLLQSRLEDLSNGKFDMLPSSNGNYSESLTDLCSVNSTSLFSPRIHILQKANNISIKIY